MKKDLLYAFSCLAFITIIGGAVYEHLNVVPVWAAAAPASLSMFQGKYGLNPALFWKIIHPLNLVLFIVAISVHWKSPRRKNLLIVSVSYLIVLATTFAWFVPELISITTTTYSENVNAELTRRASFWEMASIVRLVCLVVLSIILLLGLTKSNMRKA
jgi:hypothetical protein